MRGAGPAAGGRLPRRVVREPLARPRRPARGRGAGRHVPFGRVRPDGSGLRDRTMKLSLTSWSLPACTLAESAGLAKVLGIGALDLGYFFGPALDKAALLAGPEKAAEPVLELGIDVPNLYHLFGDSLGDRNLADPRNL